MGFLSALSFPFYVFIIYPIYYVAFCAYFLLGLLASPFIYLGSLGLWLALLPLRILISLQPLLIYLSVASLVGVCLGSILYYTTRVGIEFVLQNAPGLSITTRLKSRREHRAIERRGYMSSRDPIVRKDMWINWKWGTEKSGLVSETILEEESQESEFSLTS
ncbi:hypothetical protein BJY04DRAFT_197772 [Aspergillus karnatakaensis]|uniref:uncharacterized protein n=1 Tax=Aspergillus karnatakaensis TaxID=1810916 RepID=UPI003CCE459C